MLPLSLTGDGHHGRGDSGRRALTVAGSVVPTLRSEYKPQPTTAPGVCCPVQVSRRRQRVAVSTLEPPFGFLSRNTGIPMPLSPQSPELTPVIVSAALRRVSPAGRRPGSWSGYRPRAGSAQGRFRANDCRGGASECWSWGCGSVCLGLGCGSSHVLEALWLISTQLCTNWSGCTPVIPALARWRQEDHTFNVFTLENLRNSGSLWDRYPISRVINMHLKNNRGWGQSPPGCAFFAALGQMSNRI